MGGVEVAGRLIGQHHARVVEERTGYGHPLLLATAQLARLVLLAGDHVQAGEQFFGAAGAFGLGLPCDQARHHHIFQSAELRKQVVELEDESDVRVAEGAEGTRAELGHVLIVDHQ